MLAKILPLLFVMSGALAQAKRALEGVDPNTLSCDPRGQVFLLLPHFTDCTKFYMCAHGEEKEFNCAASLWFDFELQTCNWPHATKCWLRTRPEEEDIEGSGADEEFDWLTDKADSVSDGVVKSLTADTVANSVRPLSMENSGQNQFSSILNCLRADSAARRVPYKGDCQRYWRCDNGLPQAVYCSDGLFFNQHTEQCDFEANSKCSAQDDDELKGEFIVYK